MVRVLVVDDEKFTREFLVQKIPELCSQDCTVCCAANGQEAMEKLDAQRFDMVITDIRMPVMDGLELSRQVNALYPETLLVILSGYGEFDYAQQAMRSGVCRYLLKPIVNQDLRELLEKLLEEVGQKQLREVEESHRQLRDRQLESWLASQYYKARILCQEPEVSSYQTLLDQLRFVPGDSAFLYLQYTVRCWLPVMQKELRGIELLEQRLLGAASEAAGELSGWAFNDFRGGICVLLPLDGTESPAGRWKKIHRLISAKIGADQTVSAACIVVEDSSQLSRVHETAGCLLLAKSWELWQYMALDYRFDTNRVSVQDEDDWDRLQEMDRLIRAVQGAAAGGVYRQCVAMLDKLLNLMRLTVPEWTEAQRFEQAILFCVRNTSLWGSRLEGGLKKLGIQLHGDGQDFQEPAAVAARLLISLENGQNQEQESAPSGNKITDMAKEYIHKNYGSPFSLADIANHVGVSPNYLSNIFRKETGESCMRYATEIRMGAAAQRLLLEPDLKIEELAQQIGYVDEKHFLHVFKKYFGMTTREFKHWSAENETNTDRKEPKP